MEASLLLPLRRSECSSSSSSSSTSREIPSHSTAWSVGCECGLCATGKGAVLLLLLSLVWLMLLLLLLLVVWSSQLLNV